MRSNSRGIVVSPAPIVEALEDMRRYVWDNWNDLLFHASGEISITYEIPYTELDGRSAMMPVEFRITKRMDTPQGIYRREDHSVTVWISTDDIVRHAQMYNPNVEHPRWLDFRSYLTKTLLHELTHAAETDFEVLRPRNQYDVGEILKCDDDLEDLTPECRDILTRYLNTPIEVSAMTNEIVFEIVTEAEGRLPESLEDALILSERWLEIAPLLSRKNKNLIYKRVYTRLYTGEVTL